MNIEKYTQNAQQAVLDCQNIAVAMGNQMVDGEHIHLALLKQQDGLIPKLLQSMGVNIIAVTKDVSMEWQEADLVRERRELIEKISAEQVDAILAYRKKIETVVEEYLAEDLQAFLTGAEEIEEGLSMNDSNQVIHGNVTIQRILGRKPQFTNQAEFDDLMDSIDALVL